MAHYVDGFVIPLPKKNIHGALEFRECVGDDLDIKMGKSFPRGIKTKPGERYCSRISCLNRAPTAIASTQRS
jgi:hypothetical protein